jgi:dihydroxyacetone kinase phosphotransfer subunit
VQFVTVGLVVVSHSAQLAAGVIEVAAQMAPDVRLVAAGGDDEGGIGTSFDRISAALGEADSGSGVVVLYDLGSALLSTETAVEFLDPQDAARVLIVDTPLVEGTISAAVAAQGGADLHSVADAAGTAAFGGGDRPDMTPAPKAEQERTVTLPNRLGLHARPAAAVVRALAGLDADVSLRRGDASVDARSLLNVVRRGWRGGDEITIVGCGPDAHTALERIADLVEDGFGELDDVAPAADASTPGPAPGAPGLAVGALIRTGSVSVPTADGADPGLERRRLDLAIGATRVRLSGGDALAQAHAALLGDPQLHEMADAAITRGRSAPSAWWEAIDGAADALAEEADELIAARAADVRDAGTAVLAELGVRVERIPSADRLAGAILSAEDLGPAELGLAAERGAAAVVLAGGSPTSHAVVVARGLGIPLVLRAGALLDLIIEGTVLAVDGANATIEIDPSDVEERRRAVVIARAEAERQRAEAAAVVQVDGRPILIAANVGSLAEARAAASNGADGIGLLRTELLMLDRPVLPDEDTQVHQLRAIFDIMRGRPIVVRVLDAGGDKPVRALALDPFHNGFLGVRGLRWLLANPDVLRTQLRAISRAAEGHHVSVMAPMVTVWAEARAFREAVTAAVASLGDIAHGKLAGVGVMIEVPAAALASDEISAEIDFISVGTNDLTSYLMAADRTETGVADLLDTTATALWRVLEQVCSRATVPVAVCGEMAADSRHTRRLIDLGVSELSMAPNRIPAAKAALRRSSNESNPRSR